MSSLGIPHYNNIDDAMRHIRAVEEENGELRGKELQALRALEVSVDENARLREALQGLVASFGTEEYLTEDYYSQCQLAAVEAARVALGEEATDADAE